MQAFMTVAAILGLTALFSYINERLLRLQQTIGLMVLALVFTLTLMVLNTLGLGETFAREQAFVTRLSLDETLLNGVLCFTWGGLRGGLAVAMAMSLPAGTEKDVILHMTYGVVAFSIIVQGLTISRFFKADQLKRLLN